MDHFIGNCESWQTFALHSTPDLPVTATDHPASYITDGDRHPASEADSSTGSRIECFWLSYGPSDQKSVCLR